MDNQHRKISGYRELSQPEIELMNEIKALGPQLATVIDKIDAHLMTQMAHLRDLGSAMEVNPEAQEPFDNEHERLLAAEPLKWLQTGKMTLQQGLMELTRSVAQPTFF